MSCEVVMDELKEDYALVYGMCIVAFSVVGIVGLIVFSIYVKLTRNYPVDPVLLKQHIFSIFTK